MQKEIYLTIEGEPGQEVQIWYRGDGDIDIPDPSPIVFTGKLGADGSLMIRVPRAYLCIGVPEKKNGRPYHLEKETGDAVTVRLPEETVSPEETTTADDDKIKEAADHDFKAQLEAFSAGGAERPEAPEDQHMNAAAAATAARPWRVAQSLLTLRAQINQRAPNRSRVSDGTIGDSRHCSGSPQASDHCPWIIDGANGVVSAIDITDDPTHGCSTETLAEAIRTARDGRVKYIIWNRRICSSYPIGSAAAWQWRNYTGANGHTQHIHISVKQDKAHYDSTAPWAI